MSVLISFVFLISVLPDVQGPKFVSYILSSFLVVSKVNSTFNCEKEVMVIYLFIFGDIFTNMLFYDGRICNNNLIIQPHII